ncbi:hypothetical protein GDO81_005546 [Engystomops pustulosus]|uniref:Interleukin-18 receptor 1 n=1 Tax=Engystomops pustulosus TaxID=76066 RepID=A0AAV7CR86_ENGPU|nr:hypothetical protein GDO81_005546 [Engystomops pustulosus]
MSVRRVGSSFLVLMCFLKFAFLHRVENNNIRINKVNISDTMRQITRDENVQIRWPSSDHSVSYLCTGQTYEIKKSVPYCNDSISAESISKTLGDDVTITVPGVYKNSNYSTSWYKECKEYVKNTSQVLLTSVKLSDSGVYTYIITHTYSGESYRVCGKTSLIVKDHRETIKPGIFGFGTKTEIEVELGQNYVIECKASVIDKNNAQLYWLRTNKSMNEDLDDILDDCPSNKNKTCIVSVLTESTETVLISELHVINVNEDDIKYPYNCKLASTQNGEIRQFVLKLKNKSRDIPKNVFTTSIIASITCSVSIVLLIALCVFFRIQIVLLYRSITRVDETIGDGKEYDAYLSFKSFSTCESDERHFAFQTLVPILENYFGYKLCIFERDVVPGGALVDEMNSFLEKSRRLIVVLSKGLTSCKTMFELESGLHKAMVERKIKVILIEFTPLAEQSLQLESLQLLKTKSRVIWKGDESYPLNSRFWTKMQYLMPAKPIKSSNNFLLETI